MNVRYLLSNHASAWGLRARGHDFGWLLSPNGWRSPFKTGHEPMPYALDNGMFFAPEREPPGPDRVAAFFGLVHKGLNAPHPPLFAVVPDMPYDWRETERRYTFFIKTCRFFAPSWRWAIAVQDGAVPADLERMGVLHGPSAVAVGGSTTWKEQSLPMWGDWCARHGVYLHVLRVNTDHRLRLAQDAGAASVDGTGLFRGDLPAEASSVCGDDPAGVLEVNS